LDQTYKGAVYKNGGSGLLVQFGNSPYKALRSIYPEHQWFPWKFTKIPDGCWNDVNNQKKSFRILGLKFGYQNESNWQNLTVDHPIENGGRGLLERFNHTSLPAIQYIRLNVQSWLK